MTFDLDLGVKVKHNDAQYPLHYVTYSATKFEVATSNRLGGDTINFIQSEGKEIQKHLIKIGPFTLLLVFAGQNILYTYVHNSD